MPNLFGEVQQHTQAQRRRKVVEHPVSVDAPVPFPDMFVVIADLLVEFRGRLVLAQEFRNRFDAVPMPVLRRVNTVEQRRNAADDEGIQRCAHQHNQSGQDVFRCPAWGDIAIPDRRHRSDRPVQRSNVLRHRIGTLNAGRDNPAIRREPGGKRRIEPEAGASQ